MVIEVEQFTQISGPLPEGQGMTTLRVAVLTHIKKTGCGVYVTGSITVTEDEDPELPAGALCDYPMEDGTPCTKVGWVAPYSRN